MSRNRGKSGNKGGNQNVNAGNQSGGHSSTVNTGAFNFLTSYRAGQQMDTMVNGGTVRCKKAVPTGATIYSFPNYGTMTGKESDPAYIAAREIFNSVRTLYTSELPYTPAAIFKYLAAVDNIWTGFMWGVRGARTLLVGSTDNIGFPEMLMEIGGFNYKDWLNHLPEVRVGLEQFARECMVLKMPPGLTFVEDHRKQYSGYFIDAPSVTAQVYAHVPSDLWRLDWENAKLTMKATGVLEVPAYWKQSGANDPKNRTLTWSQYRSLMENLLADVKNSSDTIRISNDIAKAYGGVAEVLGIPDLYTIPDGKSGSDGFLTESGAEMLALSHARLSLKPNVRLFEITENPDVGMGTLKNSFYSDGGAERDWMFGFVVEPFYYNAANDFSPAMLQLSSKYLTVVKASTEKVHDCDSFKVVTAPFTVVHGMAIWYFTYTNDGSEKTSSVVGDYRMWYEGGAQANIRTSGAYTFADMMMLEKFGYHPLVFEWVTPVPYVGEVAKFGVDDFFQDVDMISFQRADVLARANDMLALDYFKSPQVNK